MNRVQLVQVIIVILAMMLGYEMVNSFFLFLDQGISLFSGNNSQYIQPLIISYGVLSLLFAILLFLTLNNAPKISLWITEKVQLDENIRLGFSDKSILYAVLLFLSLGSLLKNVPSLLYQLFETFVKGSGGYSSSNSFSNQQINYAQWIETIIAFVLLFNIKPVVNYFHSKIDPEDPHAIETEEEESSKD